MLWPYVNERRSILVLPLLVAWYVLGARAVWLWLARRWKATRVRQAAVWLSVGAVVVPLAAQFPRDYLYAWGQTSPHSSGSRYVQLLTALGRPTDVVETDYRSTIALFTGHRTAYTAFVDNLQSCSLSVTTTDLAADHAGYFLLGAVNKPGVMDNPCMLNQASNAPWAVRLLQTARDQASVFELIGPGTAHPDLVDLTAVADVSAPNADGTSGPLSGIALPPNGWGDNPDPATSTVAAGGTAILQWAWGGAQTLTQVSVGEAGATSGPTGPIQLQIQRPSGAWTTVASSNGAVGDGGAAPFLLAQLPAGTHARAVRLVIHATGTVMAADVRAFGIQR
jgi:hypothetical protein